MGDIIFYDHLNNYPVIQFIDGLSLGEKAEVIRFFDLLEEFCLDLGMPYIQKISEKHNLWQMKIPYGQNNLYFFFFPANNNAFIFVHGTKETSKTNMKAELESALRRTIEYKKRKGIVS